MSSIRVCFPKKGGLSAMQDPCCAQGANRAMNTFYGSDGIWAGGNYRISYNYKTICRMFLKNSPLFR